jgi:hypothetical protein
MSNLRVLLRGVDPGTIVLQTPDEENGQWEPLGRKANGALLGRLSVTFARKRMERKKLDAIVVGGTPGQMRKAADNVRLVMVWPARKPAPAPVVNDQNLRGLLKSLKMPLNDWTIVKIERMEA